MISLSLHFIAPHLMLIPFVLLLLKNQVTGASPIINPINASDTDSFYLRACPIFRVFILR
jgi:hypothetical protein